MQADAMVYKALMLHAYAHAADAFTSTPQERAQEPDSWWLQRIAHPQGLTVVCGAFADASLVGTVSVEFSGKTKTRHKGLVVAMFVHLDFRGQGLARQLMQAAIAHALARPGLRLLQLEVTQGNTAAEDLYLSLGFKAYGVEPMAVWTPDGFRAKVHMSLDLEQDVSLRVQRA
jgi:RimJ/RimL family protein N-acetyltransferase